VRNYTVMEQAATSHLSDPSIRTWWKDGLGIPSSTAISSQIIRFSSSKMLPIMVADVLSVEVFGQPLSSAPPRQRRNLRDWREILRRSILSHHTSLAILQGIFEILRDISIFIFAYSMISRGALFGKNVFCMLNLVLLFLFGRSLIHRVEWAALEHAACSWHAQRFALLHGRKT